MKPYGELSFRREHYRNETRLEWVVTGSVPVLYLNRLIPKAYSIRRDQCAISDTVNNVDIISWLMTRFPLTMKDAETESYWNKREAQLQEVMAQREKLEHLTPIQPDPANFIGKLRDFQQLGLDFMIKTNGSCLLGDEMGLGKGVTAIAYMCTAEDALPALIVAPLVTVHNWVHEIHRFMRIKGRKVNVAMIRTGKTGAIDPAQKHLFNKDADVYLINYDLLSKRRDDLASVGIRTVFFDEVQALRNSNTLRYQAAVELTQIESVKHAIGLSGTPIYNKAEEIWPVSNILRPGMLGSYSEFLAQHFDPQWGDNWKPRDPGALGELLKRDFMIRRRKLDVLSELPPKLRVKEHIEANLEEYEKQVAQLFQDLDKKLVGAKTSFEKAAFTQHAITQERRIAAMSKVGYVVKWVQACLESDQPIIVYFHHLLIHDALTAYLQHWNPSVIVGGQTDLKRQSQIERFQNGETKLLISGLRAGSFGINLTNASVVVFSELDWTPAIHRQAEDRAHRIGQTHQVLAYYLIADGTLDEKVAEILVDKADEISSILGDSTELDNTQPAIAAMQELRAKPAFRAVPKLTLMPSPVIREPELP